MYLEAESIEVADDLDVECLDSVCVCVCVCMRVHVHVCAQLWLVHGPMDWSPPGSSVHGIFQARRLEWAAISAHLPDPGIKTRSTALQAISCIASDSLPLGHQGSPIHWRWECKLVQALVTKHKPALWLSGSTSSYKSKRNECMCSSKDMYKTWSIFIHNN